MIDAISPEKRLNQHCDRQLNHKRQVKLKTCADVYEHWRSYKRLYKKAPKDGVEFQIDYIDTGLSMSEEERSRAPVALALHGAPGSYHDFSLLINHLASQRVRVIAPNFPEYIATVKTKVLFRHSADEKAAYLRDFLKAIDVKTIDLLVSHSSASFPTLLILLNANNKAIERQRQQVRQQGAKAQQKNSRKRRNSAKEPQTSAASVRVDFFSERGNQLKEAAPLCVTDVEADVQPGSSTASEHDLELDHHKLEKDQDHDQAEYEDEDDCEPPFEDACEQIDDNNNQDGSFKAAYNNKKTLAEADKLVIDLRRLNVEGEPVERSNGDQDSSRCKETTTRTSDKNKKFVKRPRRHTQDVIVHFDDPIEIKAVALFNPAGHRLPKSMKPTWFKCGSVHVYQHKLGRSLFRKFGPAFLTVVGVPVRVDNMDNVMLSATVMRNSKCQRVVKQLEELSQMKIPTLLVFSENDKLIEKEIFYEMTQFMRLDSNKFDVFNNDGDIELSQSMMDDWIRVMVFKAGGHYAYSNYAKTVNKAVSELLARVRPQTN